MVVAVVVVVVVSSTVVAVSIEVDMFLFFLSFLWLWGGRLCVGIGIRRGSSISLIVVAVVDFLGWGGEGGAPS